jgi:hypothetical protein
LKTLEIYYLNPELDEGVIAMPEIRKNVLSLLCLSIVFTLSCSQEPSKITELKHYPMSSLESVITGSGVEIDKQITSDGDGSLKVTVAQPVTVRLFETGDLDVENATLFYQAKLRTENLEGKAYLEMWCHFPGKGEFFSRALQSPVSGSTQWVTQETPFFLKKGENPNNVKLNLVIDGKGMVWIDDIRLFRGAP